MLDRGGVAVGRHPRGLVPGQRPLPPACQPGQCRDAQLTELHQQDAALAQEAQEPQQLGGDRPHRPGAVPAGQPGPAGLRGAAPDGRPPKPARRTPGDPALSAPVAPSVGFGPSPGLGDRDHATADDGGAAPSQRRGEDAPGTAPSGMLGRIVSVARILALKTRDEPMALAAPARRPMSRPSHDLLGRVPNGKFAVVLRRTGGRPAVIANDPLLRDGEPMPTRYWLVDPDIRCWWAGWSRKVACDGPRREVGRRALRRGARPLCRGTRCADPAGLDGAAAARRRGRNAPRRQVPARPRGLVARRG